MIKTIKCIHCGTRTSTVYKSVRSKLRDSVIVLDNSPLHYCAKCSDALISVETLNTLRFIKSLPLAKGLNRFDFKDTFKRVKAV